MRSTRKILVLVGAATLASACATGEQFRSGRQPSAPPSARDAYAGTMATADVAALRSWEEAASRALRSGLSVPASFREHIRFPQDRPHAVAYRFTLLQGQRLHVSYEAIEEGPPLFAEIFQHLGGEVFRPAGAAPRGGRQLSFTAGATGEFVLRLQPPVGGAGLYAISVEGDVPLLFPVAGAGPASIGSVFGDPRDGGRRRHEGVDIFAPRGTPVVAVTGGTVTRVSTDPVGGHVVWMADQSSGLLFYYAHLDEHRTFAGARVQAGDTLGTVGNTGNAVGTPPHLHFGVYAPPRHALDPGPLLAASALAGRAEPTDPDMLGRWARVAASRVRLRSSPSVAGAIVAELGTETPLLVIGGVADWHRVILPDGTTGFVSTQFTAADMANTGTR
jgi:peptidoglycan LD-endopeptidase LytH